MNERFPDPLKASEVEEVPVKGKKAEPKKEDKKSVPSKEPTKDAPSADEGKKTEENSVMDIDSVIDDADMADFTADMKYMRGAHLAPEIIASMEEIPK